ncbi:hypothetical protein [Paraflavitalea sp. CAU 1676]|uniref:hypothetical protein n=1 Tax=Paraflavitalea sp. CAU 1676 TaxID=3032598 RepID=UPI0023D9BADE|nr:hypothetical protein [Paraflavitalea sp. CAU 1676]MDF2189290.1 hypothetical protein [Paraflavitalea sp. CAU 1676]
MKPAPAFNLLTNNEQFLVEDAQILRTREDRPIEAHLLTRTKRASGNGRTHNHTGTIDDSAKVTLAWTSKSDKTTISLKLLDRSVLDFNTVLANKLEQCCMNILEDKETEAIAFLRAQRATQQPTLKGASFNAANDAVEIEAAKATSFLQRLKSVFKQNYFSGLVDVIADSNMQIAFDNQAAQGGNNATNLAFQFPGTNIVESVELEDANYASGIVMAMPQGGACAFNWVPPLNIRGWGDYNTYNGGFGTFTYLGFTFALHGYAQRSDTSGTNGSAQDVTLEFELSLDSSYNKAPLVYTTSRTDSVIIEFAQAS